MSVHMYNKYMGGVDRNDQLRQYYNVQMKYIWWFLFDVCVTNAYVLCKNHSSLDVPSLKGFRTDFAKSVVDNYMSQKRAGHRLSSTPLSQRFCDSHFPMKRDSQLGIGLPIAIRRKVDGTHVGTALPEIYLFVILVHRMTVFYYTIAHVCNIIYNNYFIICIYEPTYFIHIYNTKYYSFSTIHYYALQTNKFIWLPTIYQTLCIIRCTFASFSYQRT